MTRATLLAAMAALAFGVLTSGCGHTTTGAGIGAPPPPPEAVSPPGRTFDYTHKVSPSAKKRGAVRYTVALLRFGDTTAVEGQPFGKAEVQDVPAQTRPAGQGGVNVNVDVKVGQSGRSVPGEVPPDINKRARDILKHELLESDAFVVVERERILDIIREINLGASKYVNPETAPDRGGLLGVRYLIEGSLGQNEDSTLKNALDADKSYRDAEDYQPSFLENLLNPSVAGQRRRIAELRRMRAEQAQRNAAMRTFDTACYLSVYSVYTGEVVCSVMGLGRNGLEAIHDAVEELADTMPEKVGNGICVAAVSGEKVYLDVGQASGLKVGQQFQVIHRGKEIRDRNGALIGYEETEAGEIEITEIRESLSIAKVLRKVDEFARGDVARPAQH